MCPYVPLWVLTGLNGLIWVLMCPCWSFQVYISLNASLWVLIEEPSRFYRVIRGPYKSLCVFMGPPRFL